MSTPLQPAVAAPPRRRPFVRLALFLLALLLLGLGGLGYLWYARDRAIREAVEEADRLDPGWRLADLEAARAAIPDDENAALQVQAADALLPKPWLPPSANGSSGLEEEVDRVPAPVRLGEALDRTLRAELGKAAPPLVPARRLADMPRGRYAVTWSADAAGTPMPHLEQVRRVAHLLRLDAVQRAHDGDADGALASCRAALNTGRSVGDEPAGISPVVRVMCRRLAVKGLERALAQGEPSEAELAQVQRGLEVEEKEPLQLIASRANRAAIHQFLEVTEAGRLDRATFHIRSATGSYRLDNLVDANRARAAHAAYLRYLNEMVEIAKLPPEQQAERLNRPGLEPLRDVPPLHAGPVEGGKVFYVHTFHPSRGLLRCGAAGVAAERYRRARGHWPDGLEALVPNFLPAVPANPLDGRPLTYRRLPDGVVVEAPGAKEDVSFRLWDTDHRHQPAKE